MDFCHTPKPQTFFMKSWRYVSFGKLVVNDRKISHLYKISRKSGCSSFQGVCWSEQTCCPQVFVQPKGRTGNQSGKFTVNSWCLLFKVFGGRLEIASDMAIFCRIPREQLQASMRVHYLIKCCLVFRECQIAGMKVATLLDFFTASRHCGNFPLLYLILPKDTKQVLFLVVWCFFFFTC